MLDMVRRPRIAAGLAVAALVALTAGCSGDSSDEQGAASASSADQSEDPLAEPSVDTMVAAGPGGEKMAVLCFGTGSPTVVYDAGSDDSGTSYLYTSPALRELASDTQVCAVDRLGLGQSDAPPNERRSLDDLVSDIHGALHGAELTPPFVLVGSSWGGFDVFHYAGRHPDDVAGLVMLDVPKGQVDIEGVPAWDAPINPEHVDAEAAERQMAIDRLPLPPVPVTVVTARNGQSPVLKEQRVWLEGSSAPRQVFTPVGHDVLSEDPEIVVRETRRLVEQLGS